MKRILLVVGCLTLGGVGASVGPWLFTAQLAQGQQAVAANKGDAGPKEIASYRDVVKKVLPAVVSIEAMAKNGKAKGRAQDMQLDDEDKPRVGFGSGFIISAKGVIVTNNHVVESGQSP